MYCIDIETYDPLLKTSGPSYTRKQGHIIMVGVADEDGRAMCFNIKDERLHRILATPDKKIGHNIAYDLDWLINGCGLKVNGEFEDTMTREALLDEYSTKLDLDTCCQRRGVAGKDGDISQWWQQQGGKGDVRNNIHCIPIPIVKRYCEQDVRATMALYKKQQIDIDREGLGGIADLESGVINILLELRKNGVKVDLQRVEDMRSRNLSEIQTVLNELLAYGITEDAVRSSAKLAVCFNRLGVQSTALTKTGNTSYGSFALQMLDHPAAMLVVKARGLLTKKSTFFDNTFGSALVGDRIYSTFKATKRDSKDGGGGTVTGRFSSANPNMQNIPSKDDEVSGKSGTDIRSMIIPETGMMLLSFDYKQVEFAVMAHYATGEGAEECRENIRKGVDYHDFVQKLSGMDDRKTVKNLNFGSIYGLGVSGMVNSENADFVRAMIKAAKSKAMLFPEYCQWIFDKYHSALPYLKETSKLVSKTALKRPIRSLLGRLHRVKYYPGVDKYGNPNSNAHKMINHLFQGGAADIIKAGLVKAYKAGVFNTLKIHIPVHDENVASAPISKEGYDAVEALAECMVSCVKLKVPLRIDKDMGYDWGHCNSEGYNEFVQCCRR